jgi:hypothetical protein
MLASSAGYELLTGLLPFLLLFGFFTFLQRRTQRQGSPQQQVLDKLEEIRVEVTRIRRAVEEREPEEARFGFRR